MLGEAKGQQTKAQLAGWRMHSLLLLLPPTVLEGLAWVLAAEVGPEPHPAQAVGGGHQGSALTVLNMPLDLAALRRNFLYTYSRWYACKHRAVWQPLVTC